MNVKNVRMASDRHWCCAFSSPSQKQPTKRVRNERMAIPALPWLRWPLSTLESLYCLVIISAICDFLSTKWYLWGSRTKDLSRATMRTWAREAVSGLLSPFSQEAYTKFLHQVFIFNSVCSCGSPHVCKCMNAHVWLCCVVKDIRCLPPFKTRFLTGLELH